MMSAFSLSLVGRWWWWWWWWWWYLERIPIGIRSVGILGVCRSHDDDDDDDDGDDEDDISYHPSRIVHGQAWLAETQGWDDNDNVSSNREQTLRWEVQPLKHTSCILWSIILIFQGPESCCAEVHCSPPHFRKCLRKRRNVKTTTPLQTRNHTQWRHLDMNCSSWNRGKGQFSRMALVCELKARSFVKVTEKW